MSNKRINYMNGVLLFLCMCLLLLLVTPLWAQHTNILVGGQINAFYPEEPSIMINPLNTDEMIIGTNKENYYYSIDGGSTWTHGVLTSTRHGVWGDPCIITDTTGAFYFFHLANPPAGNLADRIVCQKVDHPGGIWSDGTYMGLNGEKLQDKEWAAVDYRNNNIYVSWTQFDDYGSTNPNHYSNIRFSRSKDSGETWSPAIEINEVSGDCLDDDNTVEGAVPAIGPNGEIYIAWAGPVGIVFDRSLDEGDTWLEEDIFVSDFPGGWGFHVPGIKTNWCNGMPVTACDVSGGLHNGTVYINWSDQRNGTDDTDIWLVKSTDGGQTWSQRVRVNDDPPGKHQFFTWMAIDQTNGFIYIVFYDRRNYSNTQTDVYLAVSKDGGLTFENHKISDSPFTPYESVFFGDYSNIWAHNNVIRPAWTRLDGTVLSVWTALIDPSAWTDVKHQGGDHIHDFSISSVFPNPFNPSTTIHYNLPKQGNVEIKVFDLLGKEIGILFQGIQDTGNQAWTWDAGKLPSGFYLIRVEFENQIQSRKVVLSK